METPRRRRSRSFGFWAAVVLVTGGVLYPLSFGPACWIASRSSILPDKDTGALPAPAWLNAAYRPLLYAIVRLPFLGGPISSYASLGTPRGIKIGMSTMTIRRNSGAFDEFPTSVIWISEELWGYGGGGASPVMVRDATVESPR